MKQRIKRLLDQWVRTIEDALAISADRLGDGRWIELSRDVLQEADGPAWDESEGVGDAVPWRWGRVSHLTGVCVLKGAQARILAPTRVSAESALHRRVVVYPAPFRRLAYPYAHRGLRHLLVDRWCGRARKQRSRVHRLEGRIALLGNRDVGADNYFHFWLDTIGDLVFLRRVLPAERQPERYLLSHGGFAWQDEILEMCGVHPDQVIRFTDYERLSIEELVVPLRDKGGVRMSPGIVRGIREYVPLPPVGVPGWLALYVSRADSLRRPVENEQEVRTMLTRLGFEVVVLSGMTVAEQMRLFSRASIVVGTHGAGLTNLMWCQHGTVVIELVPERHPIPCFLEICVQRGLEHQAVLCPQDGGGRGLFPGIQVPLHALEHRVRAVLGKTGASGMGNRLQGETVEGGVPPGDTW